LVVHVFSDFQCPYCRQAEGVLHELELAHPGKLRFVWHDLPLDFHDYARPAALAGREAFAQKGNAGFWKMHDLLFSVRDGEPEGKAVALERSDLEGYARSLGLDSKRFAAALDGKTHDAALAADKQLADSLGIRGTPAFVVGNYLVTGSRPREHFERLIELAQKH
jgi:protein-disulfide isomerase